MDILWRDGSILVCIKPPRVLSTDEPGGMPELLRAELGDASADVRSVHRLDRVVSGVMVYARSAECASVLSMQIRDGSFRKEYLAVAHGQLPERGRMTDLLARDKTERKTYVVTQPGKDAREAVLDYETLAFAEGLSLVRIRLHTGRTHQIRAQFSSRGFPLAGDRKYSTLGDNCEIALWSHRLCFIHPGTGLPAEFSKEPPAGLYPWNLFYASGKDKYPLWDDSNGTVIQSRL